MNKQDYRMACDLMHSEISCKTEGMLETNSVYFRLIDLGLKSDFLKKEKRKLLTRYFANEITVRKYLFEIISNYESI